MRPLIRKCRWIVRWERVLKKFMKNGFNYNFEEVIRLMEADRKKVSKEIIRQVASLSIYGEVYRKAFESLGIGEKHLSSDSDTRATALPTISKTKEIAGTRGYGCIIDHHPGLTRPNTHHRERLKQENSQAFSSPSPP
jgi:hypothetical protein